MQLCKLGLALAAFALSTMTCTQQDEPAERLAISQSSLDALVVEHPMFSGSVILAQDGEIVASVHTGYADRESGKLNDAQTLHSVASVGKMFTSVAIAQLVEADKLAYDTPVLEVIPELVDQISTAITVDHLLHHTSGLARISGVDDATLDALRSNSDYFALVLSTGIRSDGPSEFSYRNENYQILGEIIERVSGQSYEAYVRENVASPEGMTGPFFGRRDLANSQPIAQHYLAVDIDTWWNSEEAIVAGSVDDFIHIAPPSTPSAGGGAYVTAQDMILFATALRKGTLISLASFEAMFALASGDTVPGRGYGRGCLIEVSEHGMRVGHRGSTAGIQARFFLYLEQGIDVIVLSNHDEQAAPLFDDIDKLLRAK